MISWLKGKVQRVSEDSVILDVNGVGYELLVSAGVLSASPALESTLELVVHTDVKENSISLFGFMDFSEKQVFLLLKKVKGVGSKLAMGIISGIGARAVLHSIGREDIASLTRVSGIGKKSAERIIVELREKVAELIGVETAESKTTLSSAITVTNSEEDAILALERLGFPNVKAREAVILATTNGGESLAAGEILRRALANI